MVGTVFKGAHIVHQHDDVGEGEGIRSHNLMCVTSDEFTAYLYRLSPLK